MRPKRTAPKPAPTAEEFLRRLHTKRSAAVAKAHAHLASSKKDIILGVRMGQVFALAKESMTMPLLEVEKLLKSPIHEARVGAVSVMDFQARSRKTSPEVRKALFDLYIKRHDRIDSWDLVDRSAPYVVGGYLFDKSRAVLYKLARSKNTWERRTAIVGTGYFIRQRDTADTYKIAAMLLRDDHDLIHKAAGWMLRAAGDVDRPALIAFLDQHAARMPRAMLSYATEHMDKDLRATYRSSK